MRRASHWTAVPVAVALALTSAACGPEPKEDINVRSRAVNIALGDRTKKPEPKPISEPVIGPSPITPSFRLDVPPTFVPVEELRPGKRVPPAVACPKASVNAAPEEFAPATVKAPPKAGIYRLHRTGALTVGEPGEGIEALAGKPRQPLSAVILQEVTNVVETPTPQSDQPRISYDVVQVEPGVRTTTSYLIDPIGTPLDPRASGGLKITKIVVERSDLPGTAALGSGGQTGVEVFEPKPAVKLMNLPATLEPRPTDSSFISSGLDPASGAHMDFASATKERVPVDMCGRVIQGFRVQVSFPDEGAGGFQSLYNRPSVRNYTIDGSFVFAPQFGLIVQSDLTLVGSEVGGRPFELKTSSTFDGPEPA